MTSTAHSPNSLNNPEKQTPPWQVIDLPSEVHRTYDNEQIADLMFERLNEKGIDPNKVVYSGFDGSTVLEQGSFGDRDRTFAVNKVGMLAYEQGVYGAQSPLDYIDEAELGVPVIGIFDPKKLLGAAGKSVRKHMHEVTEEDLSSLDCYTYWATKDK